MSASEKLKALKETGFTCEHWTDFNASDLDVTDELIAVVEATERQKAVAVDGDHALKGERLFENLYSALAALDKKLT